MKAFTQHQSTPIILALTRRALICGLPYNLFISLLISGCVALIWIDNITLLAGLLMVSYLFCRIKSAQDAWAIDIFIMRLQKIGICHPVIKNYFNARSYAAE